MSEAKSCLMAYLPLQCSFGNEKHPCNLLIGQATVVLLSLSFSVCYSQQTGDVTSSRIYVYSGQALPGLPARASAPTLAGSPISMVPVAELAAVTTTAL